MAYNLVDGKRHAPVTLALLLLNIVCFFWVELHGSSENTEDMIRWGALYGPLVFQNQEYWRFLTAAFLHFCSALSAPIYFLCSWDLKIWNTQLVREQAGRSTV